MGVVEMDTQVIGTLLIERGSRLTLLLSVVTPGAGRSLEAIRAIFRGGVALFAVAHMIIVGAV